MESESLVFTRSPDWGLAVVMDLHSPGGARILDPGRLFRRRCRSRPRPPCVSAGHGCRGQRGTRRICRSACIWRASRQNAAWCACGGCWKRWTSARQKAEAWTSISRKTNYTKGLMSLLTRTYVTRSSPVAGPWVFRLSRLLVSRSTLVTKGTTDASFWLVLSIPNY